MNRRIGPNRLVVGALVGDFVGLLVDGFTGCWITTGALEGAFDGAFVGALVGLLVGALVGVLVGRRVGGRVGGKTQTLGNPGVPLSVPRPYDVTDTHQLL
jgi:membrane associated rhomboid family serine protease